MESIYFIGGSPCSGKSTVTEILAKEFDLHYFKVDDYLDKYIESAAAVGSEKCTKAGLMNPEEIWMRDPSIQCAEELQIYEDIFPLILSDLKQLPCDRPIITEGAAYLPKLMKTLAIPRNMYLSITPTAEFQVSHYRQREWVPYVLEGCSDKEKAFSNWMDRDILFAEEVRRQCSKENYLSLVNDGKLSIADIANMVALHFGLVVSFD